MKRPPRITYVVPSMRVGGTEVQLLHLLRELSEEFELTLVCANEEGALIGDARRSGAYVRVLNLRGGWDLRHQSRMGHVLRVHTPHILHSFLFGFDLWANRAARKTGVPVIISSRRELAQWQKSRHRMMQRLANRYADVIVANSEAVADYAARRERTGRGRYRVICNGIDAESMTSAVPRKQTVRRFRMPEDKFIIGMTANFSPVKDHRLFMDMADLLLRRRNDVHFLLVGSGPLLAKIEQLARRRGQANHFNRVSVLGEMAELYSVMDVAVLTSKVEGFPNALAEAMAAGRPVVAPAVGGIPEMVENGRTGVLVPERTAERFAQAVEGLLDSPQERERLGAAGAESVRADLSVGKMVDAYRALYYELLERKCPPRR